MKILIISQYFPPEIGAAATRWSEYSDILTSMGHEVTVLCEVPNYPSGVVSKGYPKFWFFNEKTENTHLRVIRVPVWANARKTTFQRLGFYISFMLSAVVRTFFLSKYDLIVVSSPPLFVGLIATFIRPFKRAKYVLDLRDIWPESAHVLGEIKSDRMLAIGKLLERVVYNSVDAFFLAVPGFREYLNSVHPSHLKKQKLDLMNGVSESFINLINNKPPCDIYKDITVLYSGNIGLAQNLETVIQAAELLTNEAIHFQIIGDGARRSALMKIVAEKALTNITFLPAQSRLDLVGYIITADICLVPLKKSDLFLNAIPSKLLEYMAARKPVIVGIRGEVEALLEQAECGVSIDPENAEDLAKTILDYANDPGRVVHEGEKGAKYIKTHFIKNKIISKTIDQFLVNTERD